jgi:hypothetical protein
MNDSTTSYIPGPKCAIVSTSCKYGKSVGSLRIAILQRDAEGSDGPRHSRDHPREFVARSLIVSLLPNGMTRVGRAFTTRG